ncbi:MAG: hypothetical protein K2F67_08630, partial [Eubacterium sp.]|nr:hypothetical protein [Eubacterium sp.]
GILILLAVSVLVSCVFAACSNKDEVNEPSTEGLANADVEYGFEDVAVTDESGKEVTDADGNVVTTNVAVEYRKDKNGKTYAVVMGNDGKAVTDKNGNEVTLKVNEEDNKPTQTQNTVNPTAGNNTTTKAPKPTGTTKKDVPVTASPSTTHFEGNENVPKTSNSGTPVNFSVEDQAIIKSMLEVPYLYLASYENSDGVPLEIATHTAVWMAEHEGSIRNVYASSPVVLNLFKFYGQTVVNFKTQCNEYAQKSGAPIEYIKKDDTFVISNFTSKVQNVSITGIEDLGDNNFYKVTADVSGCDKKKVVAIVQKNRLDTSLGFSIKALKWS